MTDLILRTRLESLTKNLARIKSGLRREKKRQREMNTLVTSLSRVRADLLSLGEGVQEETIEELDTAEKIVKRMQTRCVPLPEEQGSDYCPLEKVLQNTITQEADDQLDNLAEIYHMLDCEHKYDPAVGDPDNGIPPGTAFEDLPDGWLCPECRAEIRGQGALLQIWKAYADTDGVYEKSQPIFREWLEFLRGLALRGMGFDNGICQIADELVASWVRVPGVTWDSLTVPARGEALTMTLARIIRLGFPEWTIWALPLTAHEFGHVVVRQNRKLQRYIEGKPPADQVSKPHMEEYLADGFATYAMGPAYACAAILLRFNPRTAYTDRDEHPADAKRAHVVLTMLNWIDQKFKAINPCSEIRDTLEKEWGAALEQAQPPDKSPGDQDERQLETWVEYLGEYLHTQTEVGTPDWARIQYFMLDWAKILKDKGKGIKIAKTDRFRDVLNAAWQYRINTQTPEEEIEEAVDKLWNLIVNEKRKARLPTAPRW